MNEFRLPNDWDGLLNDQYEQPYFKKLISYVDQEYQTQQVFPAKKNIFRAFELSPFSQTKVVILGQDPYHGSGQADGLSFSVPDGVTIPPSLRNIYKELSTDIPSATIFQNDKTLALSGDLSKWAAQGVLLLNATLTVRSGEAASHQLQGWETFTDKVIQTISAKKHAVVFILWGSYARKKVALIEQSKHYILQSAHPSPLSAYRGFFGNQHFSKTNSYLQEHQIEPIKW